MYIQIGILITFLVIFYFIYDKDRKDRDRVDTILKTFENTVNTVLTSIEKTNEKFYEMTAQIQMEHFRQLTENSDRQFTAVEQIFQKKEEPKVEKISTIDNSSNENMIEKEEIQDIPLEQAQIPIKDGIKVQLEGQEEIYPISIS